MPGGKTLIYILCVLLATVALDRLVFSYLIFLPDNHSGWDSYRWYNFEWNFRQVERRFSSEDGPDRSSESGSQHTPFPETAEPGSPERGKSKTADLRAEGPLRILVMGSSIARYSIQKEILQETLIQRLQRPVQVELISHAALMPEDAYHYADRINDMEPDLVVYPVAMVDLGLEQLVEPYRPGPYYDEQAHFEFLHDRVPAQRFYPASFSLENSHRLSPEEIASGLLSAGLSGIRYADQWWDVLAFNRRAKSDRPLRSYVYYQGEPLAGGLYREGITSGCVAFPAEYAKGELAFEVPPALFVSGFQIELEWFSGDAFPSLDADARKLWYPDWNASQEMPGRVLQEPEILFFEDPCETQKEPVMVRSYRPDSSGWKKVPLSPGEQKGWIRLRLSHVIWKDKSVPVDASNRKYGQGLRMPGQFGLDKPPVDQVQHRRWFLEDQRLLELDDQQYLEDYMERIQPLNWQHIPSVIPFNVMRMKRSFFPVMEFKPVYQIRRIQDVRKRLNAPMLLILNPENPLEQEIYSGRGSRYMQDLLDYLHRNHDPMFVDLHDSMEKQYFSDPHHLTYFGMLRMVPRFSEAIEKAMAVAPTSR